MRPDIERYNPDPRYLRALVEKAGMSQRAIAKQIGISDRMMRHYLSTGADHIKAPYPVQFCIECLASDLYRHTPRV
jgi:DNA-binding transcriptional regulator LsrR (DeoR family)